MDLLEEQLRRAHADILAYCLMPNHVHVILVPSTTVSLSSIMHSIKSFSAKEANRILGRQGRFWNNDYFDRFIRDEAHFNRTVEYIEMNPVKARLCSKPEDWPYGSARFRSEKEEEDDVS